MDKFVSDKYSSRKKLIPPKLIMNNIALGIETQPKSATKQDDSVFDLI